MEMGRWGNGEQVGRRLRARLLTAREVPVIASAQKKRETCAAFVEE